MITQQRTTRTSSLGGLNSWNFGNYELLQHWRQYNFKILRILLYIEHIGLPACVDKLFFLTEQVFRTCTGKWYKKLIRRWDDERELSLRRHRTRTTEYNTIQNNLSSVLSHCTRLTDGRADRRADRILIAKPRLHCMQRGKS